MQNFPENLAPAGATIIVGEMENNRPVDATAKPAARRLPGLDGLRAVAVTFVIAHHIVRSRDWPTAKELTPNGRVGVRIFFVLSGFLITWLLLAERQKRGGISLKNFYVRRAFRILPPALTYLLALVVLASAGAIMLHPADLAACLLFVRNIFGELPGLNQFYSPLTAHFWSLSVEEQFYLFWPLILVLCARERWALAIACVLIVAPVAEQLVNHRLLHRGELKPVAYLHWFGPILIGCALALVREDPSWGKIMRGRVLQHAAMPWICTATAIGVGLLYTGETLMSLIQAFFFALIINNVLTGNPTWADRMLNWGPAQYIGRLSYSLYLWQQPFCWVPDFGLRWWQKLPWCLALSLLCAVCSYHFIEQPVLRVRSRRWQR